MSGFWEVGESAPPLTRETLDDAFRQMKERDEREWREYGDRVREVAARGPYKSTLGQIIDSVYIKHGPIIVSPQVAQAIKERLERDERAAAGGDGASA